MPFRPKTPSASHEAIECFLVEHGWYATDKGWHLATLHYPWRAEAAYRLTQEALSVHRLTRDASEQSRSPWSAYAVWEVIGRTPDSIRRVKVVG